MQKLWVIPALVILSSCAKVPPETVSQNYKLSYEELGSTFTAEAVFKSDGVPFALEAPSKVSLNRVAFPGRLVSTETNYLRQRSGAEFEGENVWEWIDSEKRAYVNSATLLPLRFVEQPPTLSWTARAYRVTLAEPVDPSRDRLQFEILATRTDGMKWLTLRAQVVSPTVLEAPLPSDFFDRMTTDRLWVRLRRERKEKLQQATPQGGSLSWSYTSLHWRVEIDN
jgi:hypothetical protein